MLICGCDKAHDRRANTCEKGKRIKPDRVYVVSQWKREQPLSAKAAIDYADSLKWEDD